MDMTDIVIIDNIPRCAWPGHDPLYLRYHDEEWGFPVHDDTKLFANLVLDGFQAGLSWITILRRRPQFADAFRNWDIHQIARFTDADIAELMANPGIIRNRAKIKAARDNAQAFLTIQDTFGSFDRYLWNFTDGKPLIRSPRPVTFREIPAQTPLSETLSTDLKRRGFKFVGPVIIYAFMQAIGMVDDHLAGCFRSLGDDTQPL